MAQEIGLDIKSVEEQLSNYDFSKIEGKSLADFISDISFLGFKPAELLKKLQELAAKKDRNFEKDVGALVVILAIRGANVNNMVKRMSSEGKKMISTLVSVYEIKSQAKVQSDSIVVTLPRIAQTLPFLGVQLFNHFPTIPTVISIDAMQMVSPGYLKVMMAPGFSSLIVGSNLDINQIIKKAYMLFQCHFSKVVSAKQPNMTFQNILKTVENVTTNAANSDFISPQVRVKWLEIAGVVSKVTSESQGHFKIGTFIYMIHGSVINAANVFTNMVNSGQFLF